MGGMWFSVRLARCKPSHPCNSPWESGAGKLSASPRLVPQCPSITFIFFSASPGASVKTHERAPPKSCHTCPAGVAPGGLRKPAQPKNPVTLSPVEFLQQPRRRNEATPKAKRLPGCRDHAQGRSRGEVPNKSAVLLRVKYSAVQPPAGKFRGWGCPSGLGHSAVPLGSADAGTCEGTEAKRNYSAACAR